MTVSFTGSFQTATSLSPVNIVPYYFFPIFNLKKLANSSGPQVSDRATGARSGACMAGGAAARPWSFRWLSARKTENTAGNFWQHREIRFSSFLLCGSGLDRIVNALLFRACYAFGLH